MIEGKTIAREIEAADYEGPWIVFTDGSGLRLVGWEDGADYDEVTAEEIAEREAKLARRKLEAEIAQAYRESWMMRSCEERAAWRAEWLAHLPKTLMPHGWADALEDQLAYDMNRTLFGQQPKIKARCPKCHERACPNAPDYVPRKPGLFFQSGTITIPKGLGS